jgi:hypothetical protein
LRGEKNEGINREIKKRVYFVKIELFILAIGKIKILNNLIM